MDFYTTAFSGDFNNGTGTASHLNVFIRDKDGNKLSTSEMNVRLSAVKPVLPETASEMCIGEKISYVFDDDSMITVVGV